MASSSSKPAKKSETAKVFDVSKPGKSAATATAKPVLVSNRPLMQDPMVTATETSDEAASAPILKAPTKIIITPIHPDLVPEEATEETTKADTTAPDEPEVTEETETAPADEQLTEDSDTEAETVSVTVSSKGEATAKPDETTDEKEPEKAPAAGTGTDSKPPADKETTESSKNDPQLAPSANVDEVTTKAAAEHVAAVQKLVDSEEYYLPVNSKEKRRNKQFVLFGALLIVLLAVAWVDVALDAGLVTNVNNLPHTHFFAAKKTN